MLRRLYDSVLTLAASRHAPWWLAAVSFAESSFFPIPPDTLLVPMVIARPDRAWRLAALCTVASVLGGLLGYWIGYALYDQLAAPLIRFYHYEDAAKAFIARFNEWGLWVILIKGLTPIPYKIVTITSGLAHFNLAVFLAASIVHPRRTLLHRRRPPSPLRRADPRMDRAPPDPRDHPRRRGNRSRVRAPQTPLIPSGATPPPPRLGRRRPETTRSQRPIPTGSLPPHWRDPTPSAPCPPAANWGQARRKPTPTAVPQNPDPTRAGPEPEARLATSLSAESGTPAPAQMPAQTDTPANLPSRRPDQGQAPHAPASQWAMQRQSAGIQAIGSPPRSGSG